jgi:signal transduction histidine kinase
VASGQPFGAVVIWRNEPGRLTPELEETVSLVADSLAVALHNARLFETVQTNRAQLQALSRRLVEVQENERRAIARELHDEAGQALTAIKLGLRVLERDNPSANLSGQVQELQKIVDDVMDELHSLAVDLRPVSLDRAGLVPAVEQYLTTFRRQCSLPVDFIAVGLEDHRLNSEVEIALYRILQEALTNVARHARASRISVILERRLSVPQGEGPWVLAVIEDNGVGFDVEQALKRGRLGLLGMRERTEMLGGTLTIESAPGAGTTVVVAIPCER